MRHDHKVSTAHTECDTTISDHTIHQIKHTAPPPMTNFMNTGRRKHYRTLVNGVFRISGRGPSAPTMIKMSLLTYVC